MDYRDEIQARMASRTYDRELSQHSEPARGNFVRAIGESPHLNLTVAFGPTCEGSEVLLGADLRGTVTISVFGRGSRIYIGDSGVLWGLGIVSRGPCDTVIVGDKVSVVGSTTIIAQADAPPHAALVILGDDAMLATGITIRNGDGHPMIDPATRQQVNAAKRPLVIEPHVWVGQDATILKNAAIGAGSVVAQGAIVTKPVPRYSRAAGVPASVTPIVGSVWAREVQPHHIDDALAYLESYPPDVTGPRPPGPAAALRAIQWPWSRCRRR